MNHKTENLLATAIMFKWDPWNFLSVSHDINTQTTSRKTSSTWTIYDSTCACLKPLSVTVSDYEKILILFLKSVYQVCTPQRIGGNH